MRTLLILSISIVLSLFSVGVAICFDRNASRIRKFTSGILETLGLNGRARPISYHPMADFPEMRDSELLRREKLYAPCMEDGLAFDIAEPAAAYFSGNANLKERLLSFLVKSKSFLSPSIRITDVASSLMTNKTYLSRVISDELKTNFSRLVHYFRIQEAIMLIREDPMIELATLCQTSGFRSMSSFNAAFKCYTGMTPGEWRKKFISSLKSTDTKSKGNNDEMGDKKQ